MDIRENIQFLKGVGPKKAQALKRLGIENIYDLITIILVAMKTKVKLFLLAE